MEPMRLFVGLALPPDVAAWLDDRMAALAKRLPFRRWTHPADLHVTLHFLGEMPPARVEAVRLAAAETAARAAPFALSLAGPGTFGPPEAPRVLWCGVADPAGRAARSGWTPHPVPEALARLHADLGARLSASGFTLEARPFRPHVTLARGGGPGCGASALTEAWRAATGSGHGNRDAQSGDTGSGVIRCEALGPGARSAFPPLPVWTVDRLTVFRSRLGRRPSYERLAEFPFQGRTGGLPVRPG